MRVLPIILLAFVLQTAFSASAYAQRRESAVATSVHPTPNPIEISVLENRIHVENAPIGSKLEIYSVVGIKVMELQMKHSSGDYTVNISKGYYIIRIEETVRKIAIR